jgi:hypothetical protein
VRFLSRRHARLETFRPRKDSLGDHGMHRKLAVDLEPRGVKSAVKALQEKHSVMLRLSRALSLAQESHEPRDQLRRVAQGLCRANLEVKET